MIMADYIQKYEAAQRPPGGALYKPDDGIKGCKQDVSKSFFNWKAFILFHKHPLDNVCLTFLIFSILLNLG